MKYSNEHNHSSYATLRENLSVGVQNWSEAAHHHKAISGTGVEINVEGANNRTRIAQRDDSDFTNRSGATTWNLTGETGSGFSDIRQFRLNVTNTSLINSPTSSAFEIRIKPPNGGSADRSIRIYNQSTRKIGVRIFDGSGNELGTCTAPVNDNGRSTLYLSAGYIGPDNCEPLQFFDQPWIGPYKIEYHNSNNINGVYELYGSNRSALEPLIGTYYFDDQSGDDPFVAPAIYNSTIRIIYTSSDTRLNGTRNAEPDGVESRRPPEGPGLRPLDGNSTADPGPAGDLAYDDANDNLMYDSGETTYIEYELYQFQDNSVNLVIPSDVGGGTLYNPGGDINIDAQNVTSNVDIDAPNQLTLSATGGRTINASGTITSGGGITMDTAQDIYFQGNMSSNGSNIDMPAQQDVFLGGTVNAGTSTLSISSNTNGIVNFDNTTIITDSFTPSGARKISGQNADIDAPGGIDMGTNNGPGGPIDLRGAQLNSSGNGIQFGQIDGDLFINDTSTQEARLEDPNEDITAQFDNGPRTIYYDGVEIVDNNDELCYQPNGVTEQGNTQSGSVNDC